MDYRVIDTLQNQLRALAVEVEKRHALIAYRNEQREPGAQEITRNIVADAAIQEHTAQVAKEARAVLLETLAIVEAGEPVPPFVRDFVDRLNTVSPLLSYDARAARIWETQAGAVLARLAPYLAQETPQAAGMDNNPAAVERRPRAPRYYLPTTKSREDLARIFQALVNAGYIAGSTPEALPDFLNAFTADDTAPQGRVTWVWKAKNGQVSPLQILDTAAQIAGRGDKITRNSQEDAAFLTAVSAIFGVSISAAVLHRYNMPGDSETETRGPVSRILKG